MRWLSAKAKSCGLFHWGYPTAGKQELEGFGRLAAAAYNVDAQLHKLEVVFPTVSMPTRRNAR